MQSYVIYYKYKNKTYTTTTKPCTYAQAKQAFYEELNSLNTFKLVKIVGA
jgi:hypothetical protein